MATRVKLDNDAYQSFRIENYRFTVKWNGVKNRWIFNFGPVGREDTARGMAIVGGANLLATAPDYNKILLYGSETKPPFDPTRDNLDKGFLYFADTSELDT